MAVTEKALIMEELWIDLGTRSADVTVPQWHKDLLDERERLIKTGEAQFIDWQIAKKSITVRTS